MKTTLTDKLFLTAAVFDLNQANQYVDPNTFTYVQSGRTEVKGLEFTATGTILPYFRIYGGATFQNGDVTKDAATPTLVGKWPEWMVDRIIKLYAEYDITRVPGLTITGGAFHDGAFSENSTNTVKLPSVTTYDLGARYMMTVDKRPVIWRFNISNLTDKHYWLPLGYIGDPLTARLSVEVKFF